MATMSEHATEAEKSRETISGIRDEIISILDGWASRYDVDGIAYDVWDHDYASAYDMIGEDLDGLLDILGYRRSQAAA
ncbi:MAG: hypothetical protein MR611_04755 [Coriobacteriaceae bacterium]|nr:hypothetical protein [Coriobacteriaceae bacterium]